jgi:DNA-directed RNA polymerase alpha subunit
MPEAGDDVLTAPLSVLGLNIRATNALLNNGFKTVGDVVAMTEVDLAKLPYFGAATLKAKLSVRGLSLRAGGFGDSDWGLHDGI